MSIFSNLDKVNNSTICAIFHSKVQTFVTMTCWTLISFIPIKVEIDSHLPLFRICLCSHLIWDWFRFTFVLHLPLSHLSWDWFTFTFVPHLTFFPIWVEIYSDLPLFCTCLCSAFDFFSHLSWDWFRFTFIPHLPLFPFELRLIHIHLCSALASSSGWRAGMDGMYGSSRLIFPHLQKKNH